MDLMDLGNLIKSRARKKLLNFQSVKRNFVTAMSRLPHQW